MTEKQRQLNEIRKENKRAANAKTEQEIVENYKNRQELARDGDVWEW